jgi:hypothetical protein
MTEDVHRLDKQSKSAESYKWPMYFKIFFISNIAFHILFFILACVLSSPPWILRLVDLESKGVLRIVLILIPALFTIFGMAPLIVRKYYSKKNNAILFLFSFVLYICGALVMGILLELFDFGTDMLSTFSNQVVFVIILTAIYYYFLFDQEIFHKGFGTLTSYWKIIVNLCFILPTSAIFFRVLKLNVYPISLESIFLGAPTVLLAFYTLFDIIVKSLKNSKRVKNESSKYYMAYIFIAISTIILFAFFLIFAAFILFELDRGQIGYYLTLAMLSLVVVFLYLGYIWPSRVSKETEKKSE